MPKKMQADRPRRHLSLQSGHQNLGSAAQGLDLWVRGEKPVFSKTGAHAAAGVQFEKIAKTRAVRKGEFKG